MQMSVPVLVSPSKEELRDSDEQWLCCAICTEVTDCVESCSRLCCGHIYHSQCISQWVQRSNSCPICRKRAIESFLVADVMPTTPMSYLSDLMERLSIPDSMAQTYSTERAASDETPAPQRLTLTISPDGDFRVDVTERQGDNAVVRTSRGQHPTDLHVDVTRAFPSISELIFRTECLRSHPTVVRSQNEEAVRTMDFPSIYPQITSHFGDHMRTVNPASTSVVTEHEIELVMNQTEASRAQVIQALERRSGDIVDAIMDLTGEL